MEKIIKELSNYLGNDKIKKLGQDKYFIESGLVITCEMESLPIYLVKIDDKCYFADFGYTLEALEKSQDKNFITKAQTLLSPLGVTLDEGSLLLETKELPYISYNLFVMAIENLQLLSMD